MILLFFQVEYLYQIMLIEYGYYKSKKKGPSKYISQQCLAPTAI